MSLLLRHFGGDAGGRHAGVTWLPGGAGSGGYGKKTLSGERVSPDAAMRLGAYFDAVRVISEDLAKLKRSVIEHLRPRGKELLEDHLVTGIFAKQFNPYLSAFDGVQTLTQWALGYGNGCAEIVRNGRGDVVELWPIHPTRITMRIRDGTTPYYRVTVSDLQGGRIGEPIDYEAHEIFHLRGIGDHWQGWSIAQLAAESIGLGLAARGFAAAFFGNDMSIGTVVTLANRVPDDQRETYRKSLQDAYAGARKSHGILVLDNGGDIKRMGIPPQDAQFIQTQELNIEDIARWFRVSPQKLGHFKARAGWSTLEGLNTDHAVDCLHPWAGRWEGQAWMKLLGSAPRLALAFFFKTLMRGDFATRTTGYGTLVARGIITPNEAREEEDLNPSTEPGADMLWMQGAMAPLDILRKGPQPKQLPAGDAGDVDQGDDVEPPADEPESAEASAETKAVLERAAQRAAAKIVKAHERAMAKHEQDLPAFRKWGRGFFEGMRSDLIADFGPVLGAKAGPWSATRSNGIERDSVQAFVDQKQLVAAAIAATLTTSALEQLGQDLPAPRPPAAAARTAHAGPQVVVNLSVAAKPADVVLPKDAIRVEATGSHVDVHVPSGPTPVVNVPPGVTKVENHFHAPASGGKRVIYGKDGKVERILPDEEP